MMDNFNLDITAEDDSDLLAALKTAFRDIPRGRTAEFWAFDQGALVFLWHNVPEEGLEISRFPVAINGDAAFYIARDFLRANPPAGKEPDIDGSCSRGFRLFTKCGTFYAICAVNAVWAHHPK